MEPTDDECQWQSDEEDDDENEDKEEKKEEDVTQLTVSWMFWLFVMLKSIFVLLLSFRLNAQLNFLGNISVWGSAHDFILDFWEEKMSPKKKTKKKNSVLSLKEIEIL